MNVFEAMASRKNSSAVNSEQLPDINSFVDVAVGGKTEHLSVETIDRTTFSVRRPAHAAVGNRGLFNYSNETGRYRFCAECRSIDGKIATYHLPPQITIIEKFANKRRNHRMRVVLTLQWRYAPDGVGYGQFTSGTTANISCTGLALIVPRELRAGTQVEVKLIVGSSAPFALIGTLSRPTQKQPDEPFIAGVEFRQIRPTEANAIADFIQNRQRATRKRGMAN